MKINYRPEIDGLRAIAIISVVIYHSQIFFLDQKIFKGGFIGVDIFFVISGYLITSIILKELNTTGSLSFKYFYERRIRRILPVLLCVIFFSLPFAWMYLLPNNLLDFSKSVLFSIGFGSNFYFHFTGLEYGGESGFFKPFLHTWSLSVEEQYYIFFPLILLIVFKYIKKYLIYILILSFIISLVFADLTSKNHASMAFYFIHTRIWELLAGSILAYFEIKRGGRSNHKLMNLLMPSLGFFLIIFYIFFFKLHFPHPSIYSLPAIIGTSLIIWFSGNNQNEKITKILSSKILVGIGLISYSLYLWHYPIFVFSNIYGFSDGTIINKLIIILISILLSIVSYFVIENKFRDKRINFKKILTVLIFITLTNIFFNIFIIKKNGFYSDLPEIYKSSISENKGTRYLLKNEKNEICYDLFEICSFEVTNEKNKIYLIGDSFAASLAYDLKNKLNKINYSFYAFNSSGCPFFESGEIRDKSNVYYNCNDSLVLKRNNYLLNNSKKIIIIGARFPYYIEKNYFSELGELKTANHKYYSYKYKNFEESFSEGIKLLLANENNYVFILTPIPELPYHPIKKMYQGKNFNRLKNEEEFFNLKNKLFLEKTKHEKRTLSSKQLLNKFKDAKNFFILDTDNLFCNSEDKCYIMDDSYYFLEDTNHPSIKGAEIINNLIIKEIENIKFKP